MKKLHDINIPKVSSKLPLIDVLDKSYRGGGFRPLKLDIDLLRTAKIHYSLIFGRWLAQKP